MTTVYAFSQVPAFAQGMVRDLRVRWALEEAGRPYEARLLRFEESKGPQYRRLQPFGQVPAYEEAGLALFESGAIVLHIAQGSAALFPEDPAGRARATQWLLCALNTLEPALQQLAEIDLFHAGSAWARERRPQVEERARERLTSLAGPLREREYLDGRFSCGDLMMATVLRIVRHTDLVTRDEVLGPYLSRCEARPAFQRALAAQLQPFGASAA